MFRIGKNPQNDLVLKDRIAEDFHCILTVTEQGKIQVDDLKSKYGTFVNGQRVSRHILDQDDELQIGFTRVEWQKLRPALLEMGSSGDLTIPSDDQIQDLVETSDATDYVLPIEPSLYQRDATAELVEEVGKQFAQPELEYPYEIIIPAADAPTIQEVVPPELPKDEVSSTSETPELLNSEVEIKTPLVVVTDSNQAQSELIHVAQTSGNFNKRKSGLQLYYGIVIALLFFWIAFMVWASIV